MATYTITIDDVLVIGLQDVFAQANARNIQSRQAPFADIEAFLTASVVQTANQGINSMIQAQALRIAAELLNGDAAKVDSAVASARASLQTQATAKTVP